MAAGVVGCLSDVQYERFQRFNHKADNMPTRGERESSAASTSMPGVTCVRFSGLVDTQRHMLVPDALREASPAQSPNRVQPRQDPSQAANSARRDSAQAHRPTDWENFPLCQRLQLGSHAPASGRYTTLSLCKGRLAICLLLTPWHCSLN